MRDILFHIQIGTRGGKGGRKSGGRFEIFYTRQSNKDGRPSYIYFLTTPPIRKKIPLHKKWLTILFQSAPPSSSSLYLSPSLFLPARAPSRLKNVHIVTSKKVCVWVCVCVSACKLHCWLFVSLFSASTTPSLSVPHTHTVTISTSFSHAPLP